MSDDAILKALALALVVSVSLNVYLGVEYGSLLSRLDGLSQQLREQRLLVLRLRNELEALRPQVVVQRGIVVSFAPNATSRYVMPNGVTYLSGIVTVSNLSVVRLSPIDVVFDFNVTAVGANASEVSFDCPRTYSLPNLRGVDYIELPYTIYPIRLGGLEPNTEVVFQIGITVKVYWKDEVVAQGYATGQRSLVVVGGRGE